MKRCLLYFMNVAIFISLLSCGNSESIDTQNVLAKSGLQQEFGTKNASLPVFTESAANYIATWPVFEDVTAEVQAINGASLRVIQERSAILVARMDSLTNKIPDTLRTQAVLSRVVVAKTRAAIVQQEANKGRLDSLGMQVAISEMNTATANLIIQINEKFEKDSEDRKVLDNEKKELELRKKRLDSIYFAELKDKNNR